MKLVFLISVAVALLALPNASTKDWRGIVPLRSTRADVESRFGKPDKWGGYDFEGERVSFDYGDGPCKGLYLALGQDNCKCLANDDAVMSIFVEPTVKRKASELRLDLKGFRKTPISPFPQTFEYFNASEGIAYTVDEVEDEIKHITYYPSTLDCQNIISERGARERNSWRGVVPLHSSRQEVEKLLGPPKSTGESVVRYETDHERIVAHYSDGTCTGQEWNVPQKTLLELTVNPDPSFLLKELHLDPSRYERNEIFPYPEIADPPRVWNYVDATNGIKIRTQATARGGNEETVVSITYLPAKRDDKLRCK